MVQLIGHLNGQDSIYIHDHSKDKQLDVQSNTENVLTLKICGTLAQMGYDVPTVAKVGDIVAKHSITSTMLSSDESVQDRIATTLSSMLDRNIPRPRRVHINSNEPVLLINISTQHLDRTETVNEIISQVQYTWNIWPVRIYAGAFLCAENNQQPSITLLNVSNTEIGGPSMIQLLDMPYEVEGWDRVSRREVWDNRNLLSREIKEMSRMNKFSDSAIDLNDTIGHDLDKASGSESENTAGVNSQSETDASAQAIDNRSLPEEKDSDIPEELIRPIHDNTSNTEPEPKSDLVEPIPSPRPVPNLTSISDPISSPNPVSPVRRKPKPEPEQEPDYTDIRSRPITYDRPGIQHPTWMHSDAQTSLLDLVLSQASRISGSGAG